MPLPSIYRPAPAPCPLLHPRPVPVPAPIYSRLHPSPNPLPSTPSQSLSPPSPLPAQDREDDHALVGADDKGVAWDGGDGEGEEQHHVVIDEATVTLVQRLLAQEKGCQLAQEVAFEMLQASSAAASEASHLARQLSEASSPARPRGQRGQGDGGIHDSNEPATRSAVECEAEWHDAAGYSAASDEAAGCDGVGHCAASDEAVGYDEVTGASEPVGGPVAAHAVLHHEAASVGALAFDASSSGGSDVAGSAEAKSAGVVGVGEAFPAASLPSGMPSEPAAPPRRCLASGGRGYSLCQSPAATCLGFTPLCLPQSPVQAAFTEAVHDLDSLTAAIAKIVEGGITSHLEPSAGVASSPQEAAPPSDPSAADLFEPRGPRTPAAAFSARGQDLNTDPRTPAAAFSRGSQELHTGSSAASGLSGLHTCSSMTSTRSGLDSVASDVSGVDRLFARISQGPTPVRGPAASVASTPRALAASGEEGLSSSWSPETSPDKFASVGDVQDDLASRLYFGGGEDDSDGEDDLPSRLYISCGEKALPPRLGLGVPGGGEPAMHEELRAEGCSRIDLASVSAGTRTLLPNPRTSLTSRPNANPSPSPNVYFQLYPHPDV